MGCRGSTLESLADTKYTAAYIAMSFDRETAATKEIEENMRKAYVIEWQTPPKVVWELADKNLAQNAIIWHTAKQGFMFSVIDIHGAYYPVCRREFTTCGPKDIPSFTLIAPYNGFVGTYPFNTKEAAIAKWWAPSRILQIPQVWPPKLTVEEETLSVLRDISLALKHLVAANDKKELAVEIQGLVASIPGGPNAKSLNTDSKSAK